MRLNKNSTDKILNVTDEFRYLLNTHFFAPRPDVCMCKSRMLSCILKDMGSHRNSSINVAQSSTILLLFAIALVA